jgi:hypothetical protein
LQIDVGFVKSYFTKGEVGAAMDLVFKSNEAAFEYACTYLDVELKVGNSLVALVIGSERRPDGTQLALLKVASIDGRFFAIAPTLDIGPTLQIGDFVGWRLAQYDASKLEPAADRRLGWYGFVTFQLAPEFNAQSGWKVKSQYLPKKLSELGFADMPQTRPQPAPRKPLLDGVTIKHVAILTHLIASPATFIKLTFFSGYTYTAWNWLVAIPINMFLSQIWPIYWLILKPLMAK